MGQRIALLKAINVGGHSKIKMAELRSMAEELGLRDVRTHLASGNLLFGTDAPAADLEPVLETAIEERFGFRPDVFVRDEAEWTEIASARPFGDPDELVGSRLMVLVFRQSPAPGAAAALSELVGPHERGAVTPHAMYVYYENGISRSKLTLAKLERAWGCSGTSRNWNSASTIAAKLQTAP